MQIKILTLIVGFCTASSVCFAADESKILTNFKTDYCGTASLQTSELWLDKLIKDACDRAPSFVELQKGLLAAKQQCTYHNESNLRGVRAMELCRRPLILRDLAGAYLKGSAVVNCTSTVGAVQNGDTEKQKVDGAF